MGLVDGFMQTLIISSVSGTWSSLSSNLQASTKQVKASNCQDEQGF